MDGGCFILLEGYGGAICISRACVCYVYIYIEYNKIHLYGYVTIFH